MNNCCQKCWKYTGDEYSIAPGRFECDNTSCPCHSVKVPPQEKKKKRLVLENIREIQINNDAYDDGFEDGCLQERNKPPAGLASSGTDTSASIAHSAPLSETKNPPTEWEDKELSQCCLAKIVSSGIPFDGTNEKYTKMCSKCGDIPYPYSGIDGIDKPHYAERRIEKFAKSIDGKWIYSLKNDDDDEETNWYFLTEEIQWALSTETEKARREGFKEEVGKHNARILNEFQKQGTPDMPFIAYDERVCLIPAITKATEETLESARATKDK